MTKPTAVDERSALWPGLDHIANFINSLDSAGMSEKQVRSAIYSECLQPTIIVRGDHLKGRTDMTEKREKIDPAIDAVMVEELICELQEHQSQLHWLSDADWFRSTINDSRWYVSDGKVGRLATEVGASGPHDVALVAKLLKNLPLIITALSTLSTSAAGNGHSS